MNKKWVSGIIHDQDVSSAHCAFVRLAKVRDLS